MNPVNVNGDLRVGVKASRDRSYDIELLRSGSDGHRTLRYHRTGPTVDIHVLVFNVLDRESRSMHVSKNPLRYDGQISNI